MRGVIIIPERFDNPNPEIRDHFDTHGMTILAEVFTSN